MKKLLMLFLLVFAFAVRAETPDLAMLVQLSPEAQKEISGKLQIAIEAMQVKFMENDCLKTEFEIIVRPDANLWVEMWCAENADNPNVRTQK